MRGLLCAVAVVLLTSCGGGAEPGDETYTFDAQQAPVQVDTPELREQKANARIEACPASDAAAEPADGGLPDLTLPCLGGGDDVHLAGLPDKPTVLNFWAQTCGPCRTEAPLFQRVHETSTEVAIIGVDWLDPRPSYAIAFADELGLTYPQVADPEGATRAPMRIQALPITVFVDAEGQVAHTEYGAVESVEELTDLIDEHLGVAVRS